MPGKKYKSIKWPKMYEDLKKEKGYSKSKAAAISNAAAKMRKGKKGKKGKRK